MTTVLSQPATRVAVSSQPQHVQVTSWTGGQVCAPDRGSEAVCSFNPAPNASQPFVPSTATSVEVRSVG